MDSDWADALADLRWHWSSAYVIECYGLGSWVAQRRDGKGTIRADDPELLRDMIAADYGSYPVPRRLRSSS